MVCLQKFHFTEIFMATRFHISEIRHRKLFLLCLCLCVLDGNCDHKSQPQSQCVMAYNDLTTIPAIHVPPKCSNTLQQSHQQHKRNCRKISKDEWKEKKLMGNCQVAQLQGRRTHQEDRIFCAQNIHIPWSCSGYPGMQSRKVGLMAVFDGHNGAEASELAVKLLPEYFLLHIYFLLEGLHSGEPLVRLEKNSQGLTAGGKFSRWHQINELLTKHKGCFKDVSSVEGVIAGAEHYGLPCSEVCSKEDEDQFCFEVPLKDGCMKNFDLQRSWWKSMGFSEDSMYRMILKEALLRALYDIDIAFSNEAFRNNLNSGSTASVVLKADEYVLVANIGDSKALLCSACSNLPEKLRGAQWRKRKHQKNKSNQLRRQENSNSSYSLLCVKELTQDHRPDRDEEKARIEAAGGSVMKWGDVPRVNGELAISRAIGDVSFKKYGVISEPEVTDWQRLSSNDSYLVVASDGIFEKMNTQDICGLLLEAQEQNYHSTEIVPAHVHSMAWVIVNTAFERGSTDNLAAVVLPLDSATHSAQGCFQDGLYPEREREPNFKIDKEENVANLHLDATNSPEVRGRNKHMILAEVPNMLIQGRNNAFSCYHLLENLDDNKDYIFLSPYKEIITEHDGVRALPEGIVPLNWQGQLDLYHDHELCLSLQLVSEEGNRKCLNPEGFASFFGLIRSIPFDSHQSNSTKGSIYDGPNLRYFLKRRFDRGSFGEVWLAVHKNCTHNQDRSKTWMHKRQDWEGINSSINNVSNWSNNEHANSTKFSSDGHSSDNHFSLENDETFILKRIMVERGNNAYLSGLREKHFGELFLNASISLGDSHCKFPEKCFTKFKEENSAVIPEWLNKSSKIDREASSTFGEQHHESILKEKGNEYEEGLKHIARYVESFETHTKDFWLVFRNEGQSLSKLIYTAEAINQDIENEKSRRRENVQVLQPSSWWRWLRQTEEGNELMRSLIQQLLWAVKACHDRNITHRDIKPENMVICMTDKGSGDCQRGQSGRIWPYNLTMRIIDFGSAMDHFTLEHLYGVNGPSRAEQTLEYSPPEALLQNKWFHGSPLKAMKYDMWSIGVVMLELILGTPHVFEISARTQALIDQHLEGWHEAAKELAFRLRALMEMCILLPGSSPHYQHQTMGSVSNQSEVWPASWECSEEAFAQQIKQRDPLKLGFPNIWALRLVRKLLLWHPVRQHIMRIVYLQKKLSSIRFSA
ncbi:uncharacterized protein LOC131071684 isoform X2 [Cryptomeria japonica]|uniref:uncharacterized protein LOC131071684 isoform X2 n=1 Tax=Cryptomeria japonica TaxID=3369 RepID=UPI0027DA68B8|nr:uncharacterized protein LOC131071684 isoform X2 [Cryptomeria japonica]